MCDGPTLRTRAKPCPLPVRSDDASGLGAYARSPDNANTFLRSASDTPGFPDKAFDYVVVSQTLQQAYKPTELLHQLLRVGRRGIVSFPNFCCLQVRLQMAFSGHVPVTPELPYQWYNTPNIRVLSLEDFKTYSRAVPFAITRSLAVNPAPDGSARQVSFWPNLLASYGIFMITAA